jgi:outer membrane protein OmpA-like peptidoglycan-associated protein
MWAMAGCGGAPASHELRTARDTVDQARSSVAWRYEPDQVRRAERILMHAEAAPQGSYEERDLAYIADRQARIAMSNGRRDETRAAMLQEERAYRADLERAMLERNQQLEAQRDELAMVRRDLAEVRRELVQRGQTLDERTNELRQRESELATREQELLDAVQARATAAEQRVRDAMARLSRLVVIRQDANRTILTLSGEVLFPSGRAELLPSARDRLSAVAEALRTQPTMQITIEGYTDARGHHADNALLSQRRAEAVLRFLVQEGIEESRVRAVGRGEESPIADNRTAEGRANNRRVEIVLTPPA